MLTFKRPLAFVKAKCGGSPTTKVPKNRAISPFTEKERALERVTLKLGGPEKLAKIRQTFEDLDRNQRPLGCPHDSGDGFITSFIAQKFSNLEIRVLFGIGGTRCQRLVKEFNDPALRSTKNQPSAPKHAFKDADIENLKAHVDLEFQT